MSVPESDHVITVESTQIHRSDVTPDIAEYLTYDGDRLDRMTGKRRGGQGLVFELHKEVKRTFECSCGKRFRKPETAREHLEQYQSK